MSQSLLPEPEVTLIIPAHNEATRLPATLELYHRALQEAYASRFEILVICNGCTDDTAAVVRALQLPRVCVMEIRAAIGKGGAVLEGFRHARGSRLVFADADGSTSSVSLLGLLRALEQHDVVIGSRRHPHSLITTPQPWHRQVLGEVFALTVRTLFGLGVRDTQCGAKAFHLSAARALVDRVGEHRWAFDVELLLRVKQANFRLAEYPVEWADCEGSKLRIGPAAIQVLGSFWRLRVGAAPLPSTPSLPRPGLPHLGQQPEL